MNKTLAGRFAVKKTIYWALLFAAAFFLLKRLAADWLGLSAADNEIDPLWFGLATSALAISLFGNGLVWKYLLAKVHPELKLGTWEAARMNVWSSFGKYVPGKAWVFAGKIYFGQKRNIPLKPLAESSLLQIATNNISALLLGGAFAYYLKIPWIWAGYAAFATAVAVLFALWDRLKSLSGRTAAKLKINLSDSRLGRKQLAVALAMNALVHAIGGLAFAMLSYSVTSFTPANMPRLALAYILANSLSMLALLVPAGLGVREGLLVFLLAPALSMPTAVMISLSSRLWTICADLSALLLTSIRGARIKR